MTWLLRLHSAHSAQVPDRGASRHAQRFMIRPAIGSARNSTITSPRLIPMRWTRRAAGGAAALRSALSRWTSTAQRTASATLWNSTSRAKAAVVRYDGNLENLAQVCLETGACPLLVCLAQADIADDIGDQHRSEPALNATSLPLRSLAYRDLQIHPPQFGTMADSGTSRTVPRPWGSAAIEG